MGHCPIFTFIRLVCGPQNTGLEKKACGRGLGLQPSERSHEETTHEDAKEATKEDAKRGHAEVDAGETYTVNEKKRQAFRFYCVDKLVTHFVYHLTKKLTTSWL